MDIAVKFVDATVTGDSSRMLADLQPESTGELPKFLVTQDFLDRQKKDRVQSMQRAAEAIRKASAAVAPGPLPVLRELQPTPM